jgi:hypothetical protein
MAEAQTQAKKEMTAAEAAKQVRRPMTSYVDGKDKGGNPTKVAKVSHVPVEAKEVLSFRDYGSHVVVVTKDGKKFSSADE